MPPAKQVVVFGSSSCRPGSPEYCVAESLGSHLAVSGYGVVNGGYSGTMEAVSKGAASVGGVTVEGIIVPDLFPHRPPRGNEYLNAVTNTVSLMDRLTRLVESSDVYIALPGSVGTLGELVLVWNHINIDFRVNKASKKHLICWRRPFEALIQQTFDCLSLTKADIEQIYYVDSPEEAVELVKRLKP